MEDQRRKIHFWRNTGYRLQHCWNGGKIGYELVKVGCFGELWELIHYSILCLYNQIISAHTSRFLKFKVRRDERTVIHIC